MTGELASMFPELTNSVGVANRRAVPVFAVATVIARPSATKVIVQYKSVFENKSERDQVLKLSATVQLAAVHIFVIGDAELMAGKRLPQRAKHILLGPALKM